MTSGSKKDSFADMFSRGEVHVGAMRRLRVGDEAEGIVAHVGKDAVLVDLDDKQQAYFDVPDLKDPAGNLLVKQGERIKGFVVSSEGGQLRLARRFGKDAGTEHLRIALESGTPVEGKVTAVNKGGVEVDLGGVRAFCPASQLEDRFVSDTSVFIGRTLSFVVTKIADRDVVVSRRTLLEREAKEGRERTLASLAVGTTVRGRVSQVRDFGAFVDLGGLEGLVPARELSHDRVRPEDVVSVGDVIEVQVQSIDKKMVEATEKRRGGEKIEITLSLKALAGDPWDGIDVIAPVGRVVAGQVSRTAEFGAFVRLASGIEGLLHISELGARVRRPEDAVQIGQSVLVRVISVDRGKKRVSLALASDGASVGAEDRGTSLVVGAVVKAVVEKVENYGLVVQVVGSKGRTGRATVPNAETATRPGSDLRREFPVGKEITVKVIEAGERTRVSIRQAAEDAERADFDTYRSDAAKQGGMGTLGDLLSKKLGKK